MVCEVRSVDNHPHQTVEGDRRNEIPVVNDPVAVQQQTFRLCPYLNDTRPGKNAIPWYPIGDTFPDRAIAPLGWIGDAIFRTPAGIVSTKECIREQPTHWDLDHVRQARSTPMVNPACVKLPRCLRPTSSGSTARGYARSYPLRRTESGKTPGQRHPRVLGCAWQRLRRRRSQTILANSRGGRRCTFLWTGVEGIGQLDHGPLTGIVRDQAETAAVRRHE